MLIAIVDLTVVAESRDAVVARVLQDAQAIRTMDGNMAFGAYVDPVQPTAVRLWHEWQDVRHFRAYTQSEPFKQLGLALRPLIVAPPVSRRMTADALETVA